MAYTMFRFRLGNEGIAAVVLRFPADHPLMQYLHQIHDERRRKAEERDEQQEHPISSPVEKERRE